MNDTLHISPIKTNFEYIKTMRSNISKIFSEIECKITALTYIYIELIRTHKNIDFTFGLDSFHFQNKLIELEYENIKKIFTGINNRMYGEYYKLYKMLQEYITKEVKDVKLLDQISQKKTYPIYKDLEPLKNYDFKLVIDMQQNIVHIIQLLSDFLIMKQRELANDSTHSEIGINIENIINYQYYSNALLSEKIMMFSRYLDTFHKHHNKYLSRLYLKSKMMLGIVNEDINLKQEASNINTKIINNKIITPKILTHSLSSINIEEENNIKKIIGYEDSDQNIQKEFNNILESFPMIHNEGSEQNIQKEFNNILESFPLIHNEGSEQNIQKEFNNILESFPMIHNEGSEQNIQKEPHFHSEYPI